MTTAVIGTGGIGSVIARHLASGGETLRLSSADPESARTRGGVLRKPRLQLDADRSAGDCFRILQLTPPGSECSIQFATGVTSAAPGAAQDMYLIVSDIGLRATSPSPAVSRPARSGHRRGGGVPSAVAPSSVLHPEVW